MGLRFPHVLTLSAVILGGCSGNGSSPFVPALTDPSAGAEDALHGAFTSTAPGMVEGLPIGWDITVDVHTMSAEATPWRRAETIQGKLYDLDVAKFFQNNPLRITGVRFDPDGNVLIDYVISHPFPAPDFTKPISGMNRADLGFTGRLLFLVDVPTAQVAARTFFSSTVVANTDVILNANHYVRPGDLLANDISGFNANAFPCRLVVDEARNGGQGNRIGIQNGGDPRGNYDPAAGGWGRLNIGTTRDRWTGYDFLHQGQHAANTVAISKDAVQGSNASFAAALLIKYTDPRGVPFPQNPQVRLPQDPANQAVFAYRLPNGAIDASDISFPDLDFRRTQTVSYPRDGSAALRIAVRDWDARATETTEAVLANDPEISKVNIGTSGAPVVAVSAPALSATTFTFTPESQSGRPGQEIIYNGSITNRLGSAPFDSLQVGLVRATDPEQGVAGRSTYAFGVDPDTLVADPARAVRVISYQAINFRMGDVTPTLTWGNHIGSAQAAQVWNMTVDATGNSFYSGVYGGTVDFDPGPGVVNRSADSLDAYLLSLDPQGNFRWVAVWGGPSTVYANVVTCDPAGNLFIAGSFGGTADFDPGPGTQNRTANNLSAYVLSLTSSGAFRWVATWGGISVDHAYAVTTDAAGQVYVGGSFQLEVDFDPGPGTFPMLSNGLDDAYLLALTNNGGFRWAAGWGSTGYDVTQAVQAPADGRVLASGYFQWTVDFDPGAGTVNRGSAGEYDAYLLSLTASGLMDDVATWGGSATETAVALQVSAAGESFIAGAFASTADFDPGPGVVNRASNGESDSYLLALSPTLNYQWVAVWGGPNLVFPQTLSRDASGQLFVAGSYFGTADFDPGPRVVQRTAPAAYSGAYLLMLNPDSTFRWVATWEAFTGAQLQGVGLDAAGGIYTTGRFFGTMDFDPGPGEDVREPIGIDSFHLRLAQP